MIAVFQPGDGAVVSGLGGFEDGFTGDIRRAAGQFGEQAARVRRRCLAAVTSQRGAGGYRLETADVAAAALVRAVWIDDDVADFGADPSGAPVEPTVDNQPAA